MAFMYLDNKSLVIFPLFAVPTSIAPEPIPGIGICGVNFIASAAKAKLAGRNKREKKTNQPKAKLITNFGSLIFILVNKFYFVLTTSAHFFDYFDYHVLTNIVTA